MKKLSSGRKSIGGAIVVEAAIGLPVLAILFFLWAELCLLLFAVGSTEHAFSEAVYQAKKIDMHSYGANYKQVVENHIRNSGGSLWTDFTEEDSVNVNIKYFKDYASLLQCTDAYSSVEDCPSYADNYQGSSIAIYSLTYTHTPLVLIMFPKISIYREIITVQEYQRCSFAASGGNCV